MKRLIILVFALVCGGAASQFPEFTQQYKQRLSGAVAELSQIIEQFDHDAADSGLSREDALARYSESGDEFLGQRGDSISQTITRYERLQAHLTQLSDAAPFERLWVFAKEQDAELSKATLGIYEPAVPVTAEGATHAAAGAAGGWALLSTVLFPFGRRRKRMRA